MPALSVQLNTFIAPETRAAPPSAARPGLFARLSEAFESARQRQIEREIARLIQAGGGRLTDSLERQIERHVA